MEEIENGEKVRKLLRRVCSNDSEASRELNRLGDIAVPHLVEVLAMGENIEERCLAAAILGGMRTERAVNPLIMALGDESKEVHHSACIALGEIGENAIPHLLEAISKDNSGNESEWFVRSLVDIGFPAYPTLLELLESKDPLLRTEAITAIARLPDPYFLPAIRKALKSEHYFEKCAAAQALAAIGGSNEIATLLEAASCNDAEVSSAAQGAIQSIGPRALPYLVSSAASEMPATRNAVACALGDFRQPESINALLELAGNTDLEVKREALKSLGVAGDSRAMALLAKTILEGEGNIMETAFIALVKIAGPQQAVRLLLAEAGSNPVLGQKLQTLFDSLPGWSGKQPGFTTQLKSAEDKYDDFEGQARKRC